MSDFNTIKLDLRNKVGYLTLNRPDVHNALNAEMISEIRKGISLLSSDKDVRVILIRGNGRSFCSGADLNYMRNQSAMKPEDNLKDSEKLARMFYEIYTCPKPVITFSSGNVTGGGNGIVAASDYALTVENSVFRFSEVHLGLIPATISPYIIDRIGRSRSSELLLTGKAISGAEAEKIHYVNKCVTESDAEVYLDKVLSSYLHSAPQAMQETKALLLKMNHSVITEEMILYTASVLARARTSSEAMEGMNSFFEKRKADWIDENIS